MEKLLFYEDKGAYSTSRGRWCKYFFKHDNKDALLIIGETDDYFYFTISLKDGLIKDDFLININEDSIMYQSLKKFLKGFRLVDVFEEGTPEKKSLRFEKLDKEIKILFSLINEEKVFYTIEFANLRRLGDTRFKKLIDDKNDCNFETENEFRYKFKVRIHQLLDDLQNLYNIKQNDTHQL